jgi:hypothetical protein
MAMSTPTARPDDLNLPSIWLLSCLDENAILTYKGIVDRLHLPEEDVKALVQISRGLFRVGIPEARLDTWKNKMKGTKKFPNWINALEDEAAKTKAINDLRTDDVFRNQFRLGDNAPKCSIEIIDWGLNHIDRLRTSVAQAREAQVRFWGTIITLGSVIVALLSVLVTSWLQLTSNREQSILKRYEVSFKPKQEAFSKFMIAIATAPLYAAAQDTQNLQAQLSQADQGYYLFAPFLDEETRKITKEKYTGFETLCDKRSKPHLQAGAQDADFEKNAKQYKAKFEEILYDHLFKQVQVPAD